jgi:hypothetical protein
MHTVNASSAPDNTESAPVTSIASLPHLVLVLAILAFWSYRGAVGTGRIAIAADLNRPVFYLTTMAFEWTILGVVLFGVRRHGSSLHTVLGERWRSRREFARDVGVAAAFWLLSTLFLSMVPLRPHNAATPAVVQALLPQGLLESTLWIALSISAGICEEAVYRGYLQRQLIALTTSAPIGIALAAVAFGLSHAYKGWSGGALIALDGVLLGMLAYWRRSVRPGMMAHAFGDSFAGVLARWLKIPIA